MTFDENVKNKNPTQNRHGESADALEILLLRLLLLS